MLLRLFRRIIPLALGKIIYFTLLTVHMVSAIIIMGEGKLSDSSDSTYMMSNWRRMSSVYLK